MDQQHAAFSKGRRVLWTGLLVGVAGVALATRRYWLRLPAETKPVTVYAFRLPADRIFVAEDPENPRLRAFRRRERLDEVIKPFSRDLDKILALARWTSRQWVPSNPFPNYPPWDAQIILDRIRRGQTGGFCAQYAFVFGQSCQSEGYFIRYLDLASPESASGHFTTCVYVPSLRKWIVVEAEWGYCYTDRRGHFLSALELHDWAVRKRSDPVYQFPGMKRVDPDWLRLFYFFRYYLRNNFLTVPVFVDRDGGQFWFEPYRMAWQDTYTAVTMGRGDAIFSQNPADFDYPLQVNDAPEFTWKKRGDFYQAVGIQPIYRLCKIHIPRNVIARIIRRDFVRSPTYQKLED